MRKSLLFILSVLLCACLCTLAAFAAEQTVYVRDGGTGDGSSAASPLGTLNAAVSALNGKGGTVVACGDVTVSDITTIPEQSGDFTLTAADGGRLLQGSRLQLGKNTKDNTFTFDLPIVMTKTYPVFIFGGFNSVHFTDKCVVTNNGANGRLHFMGGALAASGTANADLVTTLPYTVTVDGGDFYMFSAGNYRNAPQSASKGVPVGSIAAPVTITINGGTFGKAGDYDLTTNNKNYWDISISGAAILADDATLNITGGTFNAPIFAQGRLDNVPAGSSETSTLTASDRKYYAADGDIQINISGGTFGGKLISAYYTQAGYTQMLRGNFDVTITGTASFAAGTVIDATQVKAYAGENKKATLTYPAGLNLTAKRFDVVNGAAQTYDEPLRVAFIGDSITEGYYLSVSGATTDRLTQAYPAQFLAIAEKAGVEMIVSNYGVSASGFLPSTRRDYMKMLAYPLATEECDAALYVIAMGTNDAAAIGGTNGALQKFEANYRDICTLLGNKPDTECVYITTAIYRKTSNAVNDLRASSVLHPTQERIARELAAENPGKYDFIDLYQLTYADAKSGALFADSKENLHPAASGYGIMARKLYDTMLGGGDKKVAGFCMTDVYVSDKGTINGTGTAADPISNFAVAMDKLAYGKDATLHVVGTWTLAGNFFSSMNPSHLTIVGAGADAVLSISGNTFKLGSNTKIDNITLKSETGTHIIACYNDVEITDSVKTTGTWNFYAGYNVFTRAEAAAATATTYDTLTSASSSRNCYIAVNGGTWVGFAGGNRRFAGGAPIGTYSGNMTLTVGAGVTITATDYIGIVGANYLTGSVAADIRAQGSTLPDYMITGTLSGVVYDKASNTGTITRGAVLMGDLDGSGTIDVKDALVMLRCALDEEFPYNYIYFGRRQVALTDVLWIFNQIAG